MTSPRRSRDRPIESAALKVSFRADRETAAKVREAIPTTTLRNGVCYVTIEADGPAEVAEKAKALLEKLRTVFSNSKAFK